MTSGPDSNHDDERTLASNANPESAKDELEETLAPTHGPSSATRRSQQGKLELEGYELLDELGRGGMGVVYKARHRQLDRTVALKMILGGQIASDEEVRRFRLEAESAARLDHPCIVPIYEVGESNGHHFFAMKLIDGAPLSKRLEEYQSDHRKAAELLIQLARAIQHAHERGVLHRDIKPANILIDEDGNPWITDLGLAKHMDEDSGLTKTGLVMGSPGFMSPEQASGKSDVTTGADIYALGAILYWLIAGRPPFQGDTQLDVILQTINQEPESVRVFRPETDRDLNLICQKALQKTPTDRYPSAAAMANDLRAWLDGEPLSVKPPSAIKLTQIWIRKNFRTVAISLAAGLACGFFIGMVILIAMIEGQLTITQESLAKLGDVNQSWITRNFAWVKSIPSDLIQILPMSMLVMTVFCGIITIGLIKPKSREIGLVAAMTASLVAGIVSFTVSLGWAPINDYAVKEGGQDIQLLSDSLWIENDSERDLAQRALIQRYPGLENIEMGQRGYLIYQKIINDQAIGIPNGMWVGIGTAMFLAVLPLFFTTAFASWIWQQGERGFSFVGKSIELGIYSGLIFLLMTKWVTHYTGTLPGFWYQCLTIGGVALALYWGITDAKVFWRILGFALANFCVFANFAESSKVDNASALAANATSDAEYQQAEYYLNQRILNHDEEFDRYQIAIIRAYLNEDKKYSNVCETMLARFENCYRPNIAERTAKVCLLKPDLLSKDDVNTAHQLAEFASGYHSYGNREWLYFGRALSEMRKSNLDATLEWNQRCREAVEKENKTHRAYLVATSHVVDALAYANAGDQANARKSIEWSKESIESSGENLSRSWQDRLIYEILSREYSLDP